MPAPSTPATFQRPDLGQAYEEFDLMAHTQGFVGLRLLPLTPVGLQSASFSKIKLADLLNDSRDVKRAPGAGYARSEWQLDQDSYACEERGLEEILDDRERAAFAYTGVRFEQTAADRAVSGLLRDLELEIATIIQDTTTYTAQSTAATTAWATVATAVPIADVMAARESFKLSCGTYPNAIVMSEKAATNAVRCAEVLDFIKYDGGNNPSGSLPGVTLSTMGDMLAKTSATLSQAFRIPNVIISPAVKNTAGAGAAASLSDIWASDKITLLNVPAGEDVRSMGFGRTFAFENLVLEQYRDEKVRSDVIRARFDLDVKVIHSECLWIVKSA